MSANNCGNAAPFRHRRLIVNALGLHVGRQRGAERAFLSIIGELCKDHAESAIIITNSASGGAVRRAFPGVRVTEIPLTSKSRVLRLLAETILYPILLRLAGNSILISSSAFPCFGGGARRIVFVHDLLPFHFPETFSRPEALFRRWLLRASIRRSAVATVSRAVLHDIEERFPGLRHPVIVLPNAADRFAATVVAPEAERKILESYQLTGREYLFSVLGGKRYKNQAGLLAAFRMLARRQPRLRLVLAGDACHVVRGLDAGGSVICPGYVSDEELHVLYSNAAAFVYPTLFEGFGIPVLEAQSLGCPVVCSDIPVLHEVAGEGACFVNPLDIDGIATAILRVLGDRGMRASLVEAGHRNALRFSWERSARTLREYLHSAVPTQEPLPLVAARQPERS